MHLYYEQYFISNNIFVSSNNSSKKCFSKPYKKIQGHTLEFLQFPLFHRGRSVEVKVASASILGQRKPFKIQCARQIQAISSFSLSLSLSPPQFSSFLAAAKDRPHTRMYILTIQEKSAQRQSVIISPLIESEISSWTSCDASLKGRLCVCDDLFSACAHADGSALNVTVCADIYICTLTRRRRKTTFHIGTGRMGLIS